MKNYRYGKNLICAMVTATMLCTSPVLAAIDAVKVVAVVNDQIISSVDLEERIKLIMATTGIADTQENRQRLVPQILHQLVDESLQIQDATKNSITVGEAQINDMIA